MDTLLVFLHRIESSAALPNNLDFILNNWDCCDKLISLISETERIASDVLIDTSGNNRYDLHTVLEQRGFRVEPGEQDGFGWLSGYICTQKGKLLYG